MNPGVAPAANSHSMRPSKDPSTNAKRPDRRRRRRWTLLSAAAASLITLLLGPPIIWTSCLRVLQAGDGPVSAWVYGSYRNGLGAPPTRILLSLTGSDGKGTARFIVDPRSLECFEWRVWEHPPEGARLGTLAPSFLAARLEGDRASELAPPLDEFIRRVAGSDSRAMAAAFPSYPEVLAKDSAAADAGRWYAMTDEPGIQLGPQLGRPVLIWSGVFATFQIGGWVLRRRSARSKQLPT
jgi:hypothetical protein